MQLEWVGGGEDVEFENGGGGWVEDCDESIVGFGGGGGDLGGRRVGRGHYVGLVGWDG